MNPYYYGMYKMNLTPEEIENEHKMCVAIGKSFAYKMFLGICIAAICIITIISIL